MKTSTLFTTLLSAVSLTPALCCLGAFGSMTFDIRGDLNQLDVEVWDNGINVCGTSSQFPHYVYPDHDGHISLGCTYPSVYAFTTDGVTTWYRNPDNYVIEFDMPLQQAGGCDSNGDCISTVWSFSLYPTGC